MGWLGRGTISMQLVHAAPIQAQLFLRPEPEEEGESQRGEPSVEGVSQWELFQLEHSPDLNPRRSPEGGL